MKTPDVTPIDAAAGLDGVYYRAIPEPNKNQRQGHVGNPSTLWAVSKDVKDKQRGCYISYSKTADGDQVSWEEGGIFPSGIFWMSREEAVDYMAELAAKHN